MRSDIVVILPVRLTTTRKASDRTWEDSDGHAMPDDILVKLMLKEQVAG
jgi:hypothetical protein